MSNINGLKICLSLLTEWKKTFVNANKTAWYLQNHENDLKTTAVQDKPTIERREKKYNRKTDKAKKKPHAFFKQSTEIQANRIKMPEKNIQS